MYLVTSNAGEIALLFGVTVLVFLVQEDFSLAGSYADFLRSSNVAFLESDSHGRGHVSNIGPVPPQTLASGTGVGQGLNVAVGEV